MFESAACLCCTDAAISHAEAEQPTAPSLRDRQTPPSRKNLIRAIFHSPLKQQRRCVERAPVSSPFKCVVPGSSASRRAITLDFTHLKKHFTYSVSLLLFLAPVLSSQLVCQSRRQLSNRKTVSGSVCVCVQVFVTFWGPFWHGPCGDQWSSWGPKITVTQVIITTNTDSINVKIFFF